MKPSQFARNRYADAIAAQGEAWKPLAQQIRDGFENLWITPALKAIDAARRSGAQDGYDDGSES